MRTYLLFRLAGMVAPLIPRRFAYTLLGLVSAVWYCLAAGNRRMIQANVRHVLGPTAHPAEVDRVARRIFHNLLKNYFDLFWLPAQRPEAIARLVTIHGYENANAALAAGKGAILVSAHLGNQEMMSQARALSDLKLTAVVEHVKNERVFRYLLSLRQSSTVRLIPQDGALKELLRALKRNEIIGLVFDRDVTESGRIIPVFGSPARLPDGYAILALRHGVPIIPAFVVRQPDDTYAGYVEKPMTFEGNANNDDDVRRVMMSVGAVVEKYLRAYIDQWVYFHYVWEDDKERLKNEQQGATRSR